MADRVAILLRRIRELEDELEREVARRRSAVKYHVARGRVVFERDVKERHRALRQKLGSYIAGARPLVVLTAPVIYAVMVPLVLLDLFVTVYQAVCFPVYRIEKARRADYIAIDRQHLAYLNGLEKLNCMYCGYANGLLAFVREVAARTESHWCPIKHARRLDGVHPHYPEFLEYGDAEAYRRKKAGAGDPQEDGK